MENAIIKLLTDI